MEFPRLHSLPSLERQKVKIFPSTRSSRRTTHRCTGKLDEATDLVIVVNDLPLTSSTESPCGQSEGAGDRPSPRVPPSVSAGRARWSPGFPGLQLEKDAPFLASYCWRDLASAAVFIPGSNYGEIQPFQFCWEERGRSGEVWRAI